MSVGRERPEQGKETEDRAEITRHDGQRQWDREPLYGRDFSSSRPFKVWVRATTKSETKHKLPYSQRHGRTDRLLHLRETQDGKAGR